MNTPPIAAKIPTIRSFHGDEYVDNYEWFRDEKDPQLLAHIAAENEWFANRTAHLTQLRTKLVAEIAGYTKETDCSVPVREGDFWYWTRTFEGKSYPALYRTPDTGARPDPDSVPEGLVFDGNVLAQDHQFFSPGAASISPDGRLCALPVDYEGNEEYQLRIHDIDAGSVVDDVVTGAGVNVAWSANSQALFYLRTDESWRSYQLWYHEVGGEPHTDQLLFQEDNEKFACWFEKSRDGRWIVLTTRSSTTSEVRLISTSDPHHQITVCPRRQNLDYSVEVGGDNLFIIHNASNVGFTLATAPLGESDPSQWETILDAASDERILEISAFRDFSAVLLRSDGMLQLRTFDASHRFVVVPAEKYAIVEPWINNTWETDCLAFTVDSLLTPVTYQEFYPSTGEIVTLKTTEIPGYDRDRYVSYREWAVAEDGTRIPMIVAHRADLARDGHNPGILNGYGSYEVSYDPWFATTRIPLLDRGVVLAFAMVRGGGELGRPWYDDGKLLAKRNTFTDFIACADHLISTGLVAPDRLGGEGRSAGGLLMGAVANLAPEKFRVILAGVPFVDALTTILKPELPLTAGEWEEWGNPIESPEVYAYMKSYSPCENVRPVEYPAILATTSMNDVRVSYVEPTKWVQILREQVTNDPVTRPILQLTEMVAGHAGGSGRYTMWEERAKQYSFVLDQLGISQ